MKFILLALALISCSYAARIPIRPIPLMYANRPSTRIVGGQEATPHSVKNQVGLFLSGSFCGGSLISPRWVLTAGHCGVLTNSPQVVLGAHRIQDSESTQVILNGNRVIVHSGYNPNTLENDVTLIQLPSDAPINANIAPIELAAANAGDYAGSTAIATGWGKPSDSATSISPVLRTVSLPILSNSVCQNRFGGGITVYNSVVCTDGTGGHGTCNGDSGGPLTVNGVQIGVTSYVISLGCEAGYPAGFSRVSSFRNWIQQNSGV